MIFNDYGFVQCPTCLPESTCSAAQAAVNAGKPMTTVGGDSAVLQLQRCTSEQQSLVNLAVQQSGGVNLDPTGTIADVRGILAPPSNQSPSTSGGAPAPGAPAAADSSSISPMILIGGGALLLLVLAKRGAPSGPVAGYHRRKKSRRLGGTHCRRIKRGKAAFTVCT